MINFLLKLFLRFIAKVYSKKVDNKKSRPIDRPYIIVANHSSFFDDFILLERIGINFKRKQHVFVNSRFYKNSFLKGFLNSLEMVPVDVAKDVKDDKKRQETNKQAFKKALEYIKNGEDFYVFPEGGRSHDGKLKKAKTGVAKLALLAKVPILPVGIIGSYDIMPKGVKFPRFKRARLKIGKPINLKEFYGKEKDYKTLEKVTRIIMKEIAKIIEGDYNY